MAEYVCSVCGYVYEEAKGIPGAGIAPGTKWEELPNDWTCPLCGAAKAEFDKKGAPPAEKVKAVPVMETPRDEQAFSPLEYAALCTNLARGCEKQYKPEEAGLFRELAVFFKETAPKETDTGCDRLLLQIEEDIREGFPNANAAASENADRGALRALVWSEKVTRIQKSLLSRYMDGSFPNTRRRPASSVCVHQWFLQHQTHPKTPWLSKPTAVADTMEFQVHGSHCLTDCPKKC